MTKPAKPAVDWERIETLYRAGTLSVREIAAKHGVSHTAIAKRAAKDKWARDLKAKIKAKADAAVSKAMVAKEVSAETKATEAMVVEVESQVQARIRLTHREDIAKARALGMKLLAELDGVTSHQDLVEQLRDALVADADSVTKLALMDAWRRVMGIGSRSKVMKDMADTLKTLVALEREAFGLALGDTSGGSDYERLVADLPEAQA